MLKKFIKTIISYLGIEDFVRRFQILINKVEQPYLPPQHREIRSIITTFVQHDPKPRDEMPKENIIAEAFFAQAMAIQKQKVDEKTKQDLKRESDNLARALPDELQDIIAKRFLIQFDKKESIRKRKEEAILLFNQLTFAQELIAKNELGPVPIKFKGIGFRTTGGWAQGHFYYI